MIDEDNPPPLPGRIFVDHESAGHRQTGSDLVLFRGDVTNAYNALLLGYIALFSVSLFGLVLTVASTESPRPDDHLSAAGAHVFAGFQVLCGVVTAAVWLGSLLGSVTAGEPPALLDTYTTSVTDVLDLGVILATGRNIPRPGAGAVRRFP